MAESAKVPFPTEHRSWEHVRSTVIHDKANPLFGFLSTYANDSALEANKKGGEYPEGSYFVGIFHDVVDQGGIMTQGDRLKYVVMYKNKAFKETGGWGFQAFDPTGKQALIKDPKTGCYQCHTQVESSGYVFSKFSK